MVCPAYGFAATLCAWLTVAPERRVALIAALAARDRNAPFHIVASAFPALARRHQYDVCRNLRNNSGTNPCRCPNARLRAPPSCSFVSFRPRHRGATATLLELQGSAS